MKYSKGDIIKHKNFESDFLNKKIIRVNNLKNSYKVKTISNNSELTLSKTYLENFYFLKNKKESKVRRVV